MIHLFCCSSLECSSFVVGSLRHLVLSLLQSIAPLAIESRARCLQMNAANIKKKKNTIDIAYASMPEVGFILLWAKIKYYAVGMTIPKSLSTVYSKQLLHQRHRFAPIYHISFSNNNAYLFRTKMYHHFWNLSSMNMNQWSRPRRCFILLETLNHSQQ